MAKEPWMLAAKARNVLADLLDSLDETQLESKTLAGDWTPRHVGGHALYIAEMTMPRFMLDMAKSGFNYDKMANKTARSLGAMPVGDLTNRLRAAASNPSPAPGFTELIPVGDVSIHIQDVRRPLGLTDALDEEILMTGLEFVTTHKIGKDLSDVGEGVRFEASDLDWSFGEGPAATGTGEAILMTLAGRVTGELTGDGAADL